MLAASIASLVKIKSTQRIHGRTGHHSSRAGAHRSCLCGETSGTARECLMYSQKIIQQNLEEFARREKWSPVYHSIEQIEEFKLYVDSITQRDRTGRNLRIELNKNITARRAKEIRRWIENEQILCCLDS